MININIRILISDNVKYDYNDYKLIQGKVLKRNCGWCFVVKLVLLFLFPIPLSVVSQSFSKSTGPGLNVSMGAAFSQISDRQFSSQVYSGITPLFGVGGQYDVGSGKHEFNITFTGGNLSAGNSSTRVKWQYVTVSYAYLMQIGNRDGSWDNRLGAALSYNSSTRKYDDFINLDENYEKFFSANAVLQTSYLIPGENGWAVTGRLMTSLFSFLSRPVTGINTPAETGNGGDVNTEKVSSFTLIPELVHVKTVLSLDKTLSVQQKIRLSYAWDAYKVDQEMQVIQASHQIFLTYRIDF